jgi:hypothetical protein
MFSGGGSISGLIDGGSGVLLITALQAMMALSL